MEIHAPLIYINPSVQAEKLAFSDTFIFYQEFFPNENSIAKLHRAFAFMLYSCYLLRLTFEAGIPIRGAISFGEYYVDRENSCFLGRPVIEAYDTGTKQEWCGAVLS